MKKLDLIIIITVLVLIGGAYSIKYFINKSDASDELQVEVYFDGELIETVGIDETKEINVDTEIGHNTILVNNGTVEMIEADCPDKVCMFGAIKHTTESIVCLPNRVHVEISGEGQEEGEVDDVAR